MNNTLYSMNNLIWSFLGDDFVSGQYGSFIIHEETVECVNIVIIDDETALEGIEKFNVELSTVFSSVPIDTSTAEVTIIDTDRKHCHT